MVLSDLSVHIQTLRGQAFADEGSCSLEILLGPVDISPDIISGELDDDAPGLWFGRCGVRSDAQPVRYVEVRRVHLHLELVGANVLYDTVCVFTGILWDAKKNQTVTSGVLLQGIEAFLTLHAIITKFIVN